MLKHSSTPLLTTVSLVALAGGAQAGEQWTAADGAPLHWFGYSVSTADGWRLSGAPMENRFQAQTGAAYLLDTTVPGGLETKLVPLERVPGERFGWAVDMDADVMVIGAPGSGAMYGRAYIFERQRDVWVQTAVLAGLPGNPGDAFGSAVVVAKDRIVVGAPKDNTAANQCGAVYVYAKSGGVWTLESLLLPPRPNAGDQFGFAIDSDNDTIVVGAFSANIQVYNEGAAYIYRRRGKVMDLEAELWANVPRPNSMYARSVAILDDHVAVGATQDHVSDLRSGSVSLYARSANTWSFEDEVMAPDEEIGNAFGYSVALRPEGLVVGAPLSIVDGVRTGGAHVFHPAGGDWLCTETLKAPVLPNEGDYIGVSVNLAEDGAMVGSMRSRAKGTNRAPSTCTRSTTSAKT
ncbi:MAG: FG-GAP repeat protein [Planctomycetota bacterium]